MLTLPVIERVLYGVVVLAYLAASGLGLGYLLRGHKCYPFLVDRLVGIAVAIQAILLVFRAVAIEAFPLAGSYDSLLILSLVFGLTFMVFGLFIRQVWFGATMSWVILLLVVLTGLLGRPVTEPESGVETPWVLAHGLAMILGEVMVLLAAVSAGLYLIADRQLKQKAINRVLGVAPNLQTLQRLNRLGLMASFVLVTLGGISGMGMICINPDRFGGHMDYWIRDWRVLCLTLAWMLIGYCLPAQYYGWSRGRLNAWMTVVSAILIGVVLICPVENPVSG